ncbi:MAG: hypothetical protein I3270_02520 [Candidatus Moeniiplasma glomeromycotorum]|nr:hypothetical protein [Candidatus Moeniiplasma glomeromycotorum]MCE8162579.1 hypothetical protein [Candidatus Moeniiplasma glomeromycotorum]MCE8166497.1 hypothetical protein [Candidatus Moeniiplasma glomeromycotorum]MCE8166962.1 hypothetical protein [Candidatus Moeniiplasma glomeromycotorum]
MNSLSKSPKKLLSDLSLIKKVSLQDLHSFLVQDHTSFSVLSLSAKHIQSTNRLTISLTKNSAKSFYLGTTARTKSPGSELYRRTYGDPVPQDDCAKDAQNCLYFQFFNSKEKKLYTRFKDKVEANFEGDQATGSLLFITLTFNTTQTNYQAWTTNWNPTDPCWNQLNQKQSWLKKWAQAFDQPAEPLKVNMEKITTEVNHYPTALAYLQKFLRKVRLQWKPSHWKWVVVSELQKNGIWHFHLLSTPIVPYSHRCTLDKNFTSCWNCRTYLSELWSYGRVQSKSPGQQTISSYLAKYLSKSFHLRSLYQKHGLADKRRTYRFYLNLYGYEERAVQLVNQSRFDYLTNQSLPSHQKVFRRYDYQTEATSYFYRTKEQLVGRSLNPLLIKKNYRLGTRSLQPLNLLPLATPFKQKSILNFKKPPSSYSADFQEHLITQLLFFCETAQFVQVPLEQEQVPQELKQCNQNILAHFKSKPLFYFTFSPPAVPLVLQFLEHLDSLAKQYDIESSADFYTWPLHHNQAHETLVQFGSLCGCEIQARNNYLHDWDYLASAYSSPHSPP